MNNEKQEEIKKIKQSGAISKSNIIVRFPKWIDKSQNLFLQHILIDRDKKSRGLTLQQSEKKHEFWKQSQYKINKETRQSFLLI